MFDSAKLQLAITWLLYMIEQCGFFLISSFATFLTSIECIDTVQARTFAGAPLFASANLAAFSRQITRLIFRSENTYGISMNYTKIQSLFDENRTNIRGAAAF